MLAHENPGPVHRCEGGVYGAHGPGLRLGVSCVRSNACVVEEWARLRVPTFSRVCGGQGAGPRVAALWFGHRTVVASRGLMSRIGGPVDGFHVAH